MAGAGSFAEEPILHVASARTLVGGGKRAPFFDTGRSPRLIYARAVLETPDTSGLGRISALVKSDFSVKQVDVQGSDAIAALTESLRGRDTLLFIHGYNQTFESSALDAAVLSQGIGFRGNTVLFAWPSKGGLLDYVYDRESALIARDLLAETLSSILNDQYSGKLHIVAHSMGNMVLLEALRAYHDRHGESGLDHLGAIVLASPDIDLDVFKANLKRLGTLRQKITVITATNDRALGVSRRLSGGDRVGALPRGELEGLGIRVLDATDFASGLIRHDSFVSDADVRGAIKRAVERG